MRSGVARALAVAAAGLWLAACDTTGTSPSDLLGLNKSSSGLDANASASPDELPPDAPPSPAAAAQPLGAAPTQPGLLGSDPNDDLSTGKKYYRAANFGMAERYFRRAVELHPRDAEAWLDLAASYDRLRRFDLADRAYGQAISIVGPTAEILNNQGYSYMLRGDTKRAREKLMAAQRKDPANRYVQNNLQLLAASFHEGKAIE
jgi:Flp pilus assembly protein TadD